MVLLQKVQQQGLALYSSDGASKKITKKATALSVILQILFVILVDSVQQALISGT